MDIRQESGEADAVEFSDCSLRIAGRERSDAVMMNGNPNRYGFPQEIKAAGLQGVVDMAVSQVDQKRPGSFLDEAANEGH